MEVERLIEKAAFDLAQSSYAIALTGAGMSTESGIPDFRGPKGIWTRDPEAEKRAYEIYQKFLEDPVAYWHERLSGPSLLGDLSRVTPNEGHYALAELEKMGIIKCVITQNVDNLHQRAGTVNVVDYHGNAFKLRCPSCGSRFKMEEFPLERLLAEGRLPPRCPFCTSPLKADVVHFREPIPGDVARRAHEETAKCDLMLICGTKAVVYPFAALPRMARQKSNVKIIEVNMEPTALTFYGISDYLISGKTGEVLPRIVRKVKELVPSGTPSL